MAYDDRYGGGDWSRERGEPRQRDRFGRDEDRERSSYGRSERDFDRGYGRDPNDRSPGSHTDYYRGGDRGQSRMGPEGSFESRSDYRRTEHHSDQGQAGSASRGERSRDFADENRGYGGVDQGIGNYGQFASGGGYEGAYGAGGMAGPGFDPEFGGPRFDRQDVGSTGTHGAHPVASPFGTAQQTVTGGGFMGGSSARARAILQQHEQSRGGGQYGQASQERGHSEYDPHYQQWRQSQIESLDRDYDEYRQENASRFESEFGSWREKRGQQRQSMGRVTEHMEVVGSDGQHVGTVDKVRDGRIVLTKSDPSAGGHHHSIPCGWLESVDDKVTLNKSAEEAMQAWRDEEANRALFEREDRGSNGPHILGRSFSGTYRDER